MIICLRWLFVCLKSTGEARETERLATINIWGSTKQMKLEIKVKHLSWQIWRREWTSDNLQVKMLQIGFCLYRAEENAERLVISHHLWYIHILLFLKYLLIFGCLGSEPLHVHVRLWHLWSLHQLQGGFCKVRPPQCINISEYQYLRMHIYIYRVFFFNWYPPKS